MKFNKLSENATVPFKAYPSSCGYDLASAITYVLEPSQIKKIKTDIAFEIPEGFYGRICGRSGLVYKHSVEVLAG